MANTSMAKIPDLAPEAIPLASVLRSLLVRRNLYHVKISQDAGLGAGYIRDIIRGKSRNPKAAELQRLAEALGVDIAELTEVGAVARNHLGNDHPYTDEESGWVDLWRLLNDEGRDLALGYVAKLITKHARRR